MTREGKSDGSRAVSPENQKKRMTQKPDHLDCNVGGGRKSGKLVLNWFGGGRKRKLFAQISLSIHIFSGREREGKSSKKPLPRFKYHRRRKVGGGGS